MITIFSSPYHNACIIYLAFILRTQEYLTTPMQIKVEKESSLIANVSQHEIMLSTTDVLSSQ